EFIVNSPPRRKRRRHWGETLFLLGFDLQSSVSTVVGRLSARPLSPPAGARRLAGRARIPVFKPNRCCSRDARLWSAVSRIAAGRSEDCQEVDPPSNAGRTAGPAGSVDELRSDAFRTADA